MITTLILNPPIVLTNRISFKWKLLLKTIWLLGICLVFGLLVFYIFQINAMVFNKDVVQKYEKKFEEISKENKDLEIKTLNAISLENILTSAENLNFEKTEKIQYIKVINNEMVIK